VAFDAHSPFGIMWGHVGLVVVAILLSSVLLLVLAHRGRVLTVHRGLLVGFALGAVAWTFFTLGAPVMVPSDADPQGAECLVNPIGDNPDYVVPWDTECGRALGRHLASSIGPSIAMVAGTLGATFFAVVRRRNSLVDGGH
jgi:hypothetical protein